MNRLSMLASLLSQTANVLFLGGHSDQTVSSRTYVNRHKPRWSTAYKWINRMFFWQEDHCYESFLSDIEYAQRMLNERV